MDNPVDKFNKMEVDKATYLAVWDDINKFIFPNSEQFYSQYAGGEKRRRLQFDGTAERALEIFASSVVGLIANPVTKYINFEPRDKDLLEDREVQEFIEEAQDKVLSVFNDPATKFYDNFFCCVQHLGAYGTSALMSDTDEKHVAVFKALSPRSFNFEESFNGSKESIYISREYTMYQLRQLKDERGWVLPANMERKEDKDKVKVVMYVCKNKNYDPKKIDSKFKKFKSEYWLKEEKFKLHESGFDTFPAPIGGWGMLDGEKWHDSPGRVALTDVKVLNASERHLTFAEEYSLRPSLFLSSEAKFGKLNLSPGSINAGRGNPNDTLRQLSINGDLSFSLERNRLRREVVMQAFYVDVFQTLSDNTMTATEVQIRAQEKLRGLAPKIARIQSDILGPTAERILSLLISRGDLKPPQSLMGRELEVTYTSPMAIAQRSQEAVNIQLFFQDMSMIAQFNPKALLRVDFDAMVEEIAEIRGVPAKALLEMDEYEELLQQMQQQQQLQQGLQVAQQAGEAGQALQALDGQSA